ncbi:MAG: DUF3472 domain-containing protein [Armatimonadota bacterium]
MRMILSGVMVALVALLYAVVPVLAQTKADEPPGATVVTGANGSPAGVRVPGYLSYSYPDRDALVISPTSGVDGWKNSAVTVVWYGNIKSAGALIPTIEVRLPRGESVRYRLTLTPGGVYDSKPAASQSVEASVSGEGVDNAARAMFPALSAPATGYMRFTLQGLKKSGATYGNINALVLTGAAAVDAHFNTIQHRGAASVHLRYPTAPELGPITAFYTEVTATADPIATYYCAAGWSRGYFGYQVNSATERRIIFSVWDAGKEPTDPKRVAAPDRVELLEKGKDVFADRFGNEGTGGHSHLVYPWKTGKTYQFLVTARPDGAGHAIYAGYFYFPERSAWGLIARFRAPVKTPPGETLSPDSSLRGLYAFDEDFWAGNGDQRREALFGNQWVRNGDGKWHTLTEATFSHTDRTNRSRIDFAAAPTAKGDAYILATGGYVAPAVPIVYGDKLTRKSVGAPPSAEAQSVATRETAAPVSPR